MAYLDQKVGIVTGGGTGIGRATALAMARTGAPLVIGNRNAKLGEDVVRAIEQAGGRAVFQVTDVSKPEDARRGTSPAIRCRSMAASVPSDDRTFRRLSMMINS
jgi:NAD(P)-dependent dehydrogenase (short-subunit alcohol dehydrogenase family)